MKNYLLRASFLLSLISVMASCSVSVAPQSSTPSKSPTVENKVNLLFAKYSPVAQKFIDEMIKQGNNVEPTDSIKLYYFTVKAEVIYIGIEKVMILVYKDHVTADKDVNLIMDNGVYIGTKEEKIDWVSDPHFFRKDNYMIEYVGVNKKIIQSIENIVGKQFAGYNKT